MRLYTIIFFLISSLPGKLIFCQHIENVWFEQEGKVIKIYYDIVGSKGDMFNIDIYCSTDNGYSWGYPLKEVSGDVGPDQMAGKGKTIIWDVLKEKKSINGDIMFEIKAGVIPFINEIIDHRDGKVYEITMIGEQIWMAENLAYLPEVNPSNEGSYTFPYYYVYGYEGTDVQNAKETENYAKYGVLYNWPAAMGSATPKLTGAGKIRGACPEGWHLPSNEEWEQLAHWINTNQGGFSSNGDDWKGIGKILKAQTGWDGDGNGTDLYGFNAIPGGSRYGHGYFVSMKQSGDWWSSTEYDSSNAWSRYILCYYSNFNKSYYGKDRGFNVRCVKDD